jgi:hypothetical protein
MARGRQRDRRAGSATDIPEGSPLIAIVGWIFVTRRTRRVLYGLLSHRPWTAEFQGQLDITSPFPNTALPID